MNQIELFAAVKDIYASTAETPLSNAALYEQLSMATGVDASTWSRKEPIGQSGEMHSPARRKVRWYQQTLKRLGVIERVPGHRGTWRAKGAKQDELTPTPPKTYLVAFSTKLGVAIWGRCGDVFPALGEPIHLCLTSPPYPLSRPRAYGNPTANEYTDFVCEALEPIVKNLVAGGSICLNISNDIFEPKSPARSLYREKLVIALHERLGLWKMDELVWENKSKAPGPIAWASKQRVQLNTGWEPVYWFTNDPSQVRSDNRRVLQPHTQKHLKLIAQGGEQRSGKFGDGANRIRPGSFSNATAGKIPKNVISVGHRCAHQSPARDALRSAGLSTHGAAMPYELANMLVKFLTLPGDLVVDPFHGIGTTAQAAQDNGCKWVGTEMMYEYAWASGSRFENSEGFERELVI